jgi:predicted dehydrogenase
MKTGIGLYGTNGHQIEGLFESRSEIELVAISAYDSSYLPERLRFDSNIKNYPTLDELLKDDRVELVSLCSPRRKDQAGDTIRCLEAGKHVYAEKPCAMTERELDMVVDASLRTGYKFHEMAGTAFEQPYLSMRNIVQAGTIGEVVQVFAQKSYPYHSGRPQDEEVDGGLTMQAGVHALRFVEHVACQRVSTIHAIETRLGNPETEENLHMAVSYCIRLENDGIASMIANYLNPEGFGLWGNEHLRIFGTKGFIEAVDGGTRTRLIVGINDMGPIGFSGEGKNYFDFFLDELSGRGSMPVSLEEELHPTRMVIKAKQSAISSHD